MHRIGLFILFTWLIFNFVLAAGIVFGMTFLHINAPGIKLMFDDAAIQVLSPKVLKTMNAFAVLMNGSIMALCGLSLFLLRKALSKKLPWIFSAVAIAVFFVQCIGFVSDSFLGNRDFLGNIFSTVTLVVGLVLSYHSFIPSKRHTHV